ncbi:hypothetical protein I4U23_004894 [Adineta vaga]|nr:hypothetical protein I4U23_004894 [Adineta vaga]
MPSLRYIAFGFFLLLALSALADGLKCYQCANCNSPFKPSDATEVTSSDARASCWKTTARNVATTRGITTDCKQVDAAGIGTWCCNTDLCNGAIPTKSSVYLVLTIATIVATMLI